MWGLRLFPRSGGADELALDQALSALSGPGRAAYALRGLERLPDGEVRRVLDAAGAADADAALREAGTVAGPYPLLDSPEFDPCSLQARPTDLLRRRRHLRAALVAGCALVVCGALLGPDGGWGPDGAAAPPYARNPAAEAALDPGKLVRVAPTAWRTSARADFSVWPARGALTGDRALLRRALAVWARPGDPVAVSATPGPRPAARPARRNCCTRGRSTPPGWCSCTTGCGWPGTPSRRTARPPPPSTSRAPTAPGAPRRPPGPGGRWS
ncbi:hypothetical protein SFUMM280S_07841 [Streptomyces fumanus]